MLLCHINDNNIVHWKCDYMKEKLFMLEQPQFLDISIVLCCNIVHGLHS